MFCAHVEQVFQKKGNFRSRRIVFFFLSVLTCCNKVLKDFFFVTPKSLSVRIFCKNREKHHNILAGLCPLIQSAGRPKKMLIYWKRCECSNGELKHSSIRFSIHSFDHLALMCSSMYAKASCDAPHKQSTQTQTVSVFLSMPPPLP